MAFQLAPLRTECPELVPVSVELAKALPEGDFSGVIAGEGWPHGDSNAALSHVASSGVSTTSLVEADGAVIGDRGTHGPPDENGVVADLRTRTVVRAR